MKKIILLTLLPLLSIAQTYKITYQKSFNGNVMENQDNPIVFTQPNKTLVSTLAIEQQKAAYPYELTYLDRTKPQTAQFLAQLNNTQNTCTIDSLSLSKYTFTITSETKKILNYTCVKATTTINSNSIEVWFTNQLPVKGAPSLLGQNLGLVLEVIRNGNFSIQAQKIEKIKQFPTLPHFTSPVDKLTYNDLLWKSRFITIPIFTKQVINFSESAVSNDSVFRFGKGTIAVRKIKIPEIKPGSLIFIDVTEQSKGDAYDRTGTVFLIPTQNPNTYWNGLQNGVTALPTYTNGNGKTYQGIALTETYQPMLELIRFFSPFGVGHFNTIEIKDKNWQNKVFYRQDISDYASQLSGKEVYIGATISNYDAGGHEISINLTIHNEEGIKGNTKYVLPLANTLPVMEAVGQEYAHLFDSEKGLELTFELAQPLANAQLRYISTGHGGWENGDEFVPKLNSIFLNNKPVYAFIPWREDCGSYRLYNPASGNFGNGLSSSDYSRSNWCPGTVTQPEIIPLGDLPPGKHTLKITIPQGKPEGTSFSHWNVSATLIGDQK